MGILRKIAFLAVVATAAVALDPDGGWSGAEPLAPAREALAGAKAAYTLCTASGGLCGAAAEAGLEQAKSRLTTASVPAIAEAPPVLVDMPLPPRRPRSGPPRQTP